MESYKKRGKTEVYPFWYIDDIKNMLDYFKMKEQWHWYLVFNFGLLLGRRVSDTLAFKWSDFYEENGRMRDELDVVEQKTGKLARPYISPACKTAIKLYIEKTGINPMHHYNEFIFPTDNKIELLNNKDKYDPDEYEDLMKVAIHSQSCAYRKQFKIAADACEIKYPVSTHSTRKTFGYWSVKIHPYDITTIDQLQNIFNHSDRNTTLSYIGLNREKEVKLYNDMGNFIEDITNGKKPVIKNSPVIPLKSEDFREILSQVYEMGKNEEDKFDAINKIIGIAESKMI